ncbi:organic solute transporter Ostalpha-domain-containing protein [Russula aff. rugulosa BPL654]|nr:organic solute transporter Ostalpha-domain-containing protein [Russula aff. rugulosa BPL654]
MSKNATCFTPEAPERGPSLFQHGKVVFQAHDVGWIITGFFTIVATVVSFWLINKHLQWYTIKREQRYIIRLLLCLASYLFWDNATPLLLIRDAYEAIILTAFFYLLLTYLSPDPEVQKAIFRKRGLSKEADAESRRRGQPPRKWVFPLGFVRWKPQDGLFFLQLMKWCVLQYCVIRPTTTLAAVILNHIGLYCGLLGLLLGISSIISISVTIAMYCLLQLYLCVATELAPIALLFLTFWQSTFLSLLSVIGVVKDTPYMTAGDINIGWGAILETFEMSIFAFVHIKAFSYKPYRPLTPNAKRTPRLRSFAHTMDFRETFRELYASLVYMCRRMRGIETDPLAHRMAVLEHAFDKNLPDMRRGRPKEEKELVLEVDTTVEVAVDGEKQWLVERSEALDIQFEKEIENRGYGRSNPDPDAIFHQNYIREHKHRSWRRSRYERAAQSKPAHEEPVAKSRSRRDSRNPEESVRVYDDHPPPSILRMYRTASQALPQGEKVPQLPQNNMVQDLPSPPMRDRYPLPLLNANIAIARADTVFARLFSNQPPRSDGGHTLLSGSDSVVSPSLQSHRTHLPLNAAPTVLPENIDARRSVEAATWRPRRSAHRRELAHFQSSLAHGAASARAVPASNSVSDPVHIANSSRKEEWSHHVRPVADVRELPHRQTPFVISHRLPEPRTNADAVCGDHASSSRSPASAGVAVPTHTFSPKPTRLSHSKGSPRNGRGMPLRPSSFPLNYNILYSLPDARSPPTAPRADHILTPRRDS